MGDFNLGFDQLKPIREAESIAREKMLIAILKRPTLFQDYVDEIQRKKVAGEDGAVKSTLLCVMGRLVVNASHSSYNILFSDDAGKGKSFVARAVCDILPKECFVYKTRISPTALTYLHNAENDPTWTWDGKVFNLEDISEQILHSDVFKVLCSEGSSATITQKLNGRITAIDVEIKGKPVLITSTASANPNAELTRRFVMLQLINDKEQTKRIMNRQAKNKMTGELCSYDPFMIDAQKCLERVSVIVPFAECIAEKFPHDNIIMRTNFIRFLDFISASAAFHQYQRMKDAQGRIIAEQSDYDIAREVFLYLFSNRELIPLTSNQRKIMDVFKNNPTVRGNVSYLHGGYIKFISDRALQTNLEKLVEYGFLTTFTEQDSFNRDIVVYALANKEVTTELTLPTYKELEYTSIPSIPSLPTLPSLTSVPSIPSIPNEVPKIPKVPKAKNAYISPKKRHQKGNSINSWGIDFNNSGVEEALKDG